MKNPVLSEKEGKKLLYRCMLCDKPIEGFYGRWELGGTCSKACEAIQESKPRFPDHPEKEIP